MVHVSRLSYVILAAIVLILVAVLWVQSPDHSLRVIGLLCLLAAVMAAWIGLRRGEATPHPQKRIRRGRAAEWPLLVYFFSDYSALCLLQTPVIRRVERRLKGRADEVAVNINTAEGQELAREFGATPGTLLGFDRTGQEVYRSHFPAARALFQALALND